MPMIDVYATKHLRGSGLARAAAGSDADADRGGPGPPHVSSQHGRVRPLDPDRSIANVEGESDYVRVQVLTNQGALDRAKQSAVVEQFTGIVAEAADRPELKERTWVLLTEAPDGGWGLWGHAHTNAELVAAAHGEAANLTGDAGG